MGNPLYSERPNPCHGCPDRVPACSDHCRKPDFLKWKAEQETIRQNRRKYAEATDYSIQQILKNRR